MNLAHEPTKILITGASGEGKSTYFTRYIYKALGTIYNKIFVFDHQGELTIRLGYPPSFTEDELTQNWQDKQLIIFDPSVLFPGETENAWNFFCEWTFERCQNNLGYKKLLACDELQMFSSTKELAWEQCLIIETGRKYELDFLGIAQQYNLVHNRVRNQMTEFVTFRQEDKLILDALEEKGFQPDVVKRLGKGEFLIRNIQGAYVKAKIDLTRPTERTMVKSSEVETLGSESADDIK